MATATRIRPVNRIKIISPSNRRPLDRTWKPPKSYYVIALTFEDGSEKVYVYLYSSLTRAEREAKWFVKEDPYGDGIVAARVRRMVSMTLADPS